MEYRSVQTLIVPLDTRKQLDHFKQLADAEVDQPNYTSANAVTGKLGPSYSDLEFHYTTVEGQRVVLSCARKEFCPAQEFSYLASHPAHYILALTNLIKTCLGIDGIGSGRSAPELFRAPTASVFPDILKDSTLWTVRRITPKSFPQLNLAQLFEIDMVFLHHATELRGAEWDVTFIRDAVVRYIESVAMFS